ncbi:hypothetical protein B9Z55_022903 [Caenorhabditis nigoni]|uniref:Uncharacterized protein n=1 Tax=Caenorhabditis nigoni TaxID=1611254 RepID=A0A2G5SM91_9PELO|nr:hypothetical protein B9Z55_022903 [Caenorhabditis nigoni]
MVDTKIAEKTREDRYSMKQPTRIGFRGENEKVPICLTPEPLHKTAPARLHGELSYLKLCPNAFKYVCKGSICVTPEPLHKTAPARLHGELSYLNCVPTHSSTCIKVHGLDCELVHTMNGLEVARVSLLDMDFLHTFVLPQYEVVSLNTAFAGTTIMDSPLWPT